MSDARAWIWIGRIGGSGILAPPPPATALLTRRESGLGFRVEKVNMDREASKALAEECAEISAYTIFAWIG
ncbi:MAG: hypothetical protein IKW24_01925 [Clostridia bacterium]|nr:hypothetical protein [Clostridia bacterium]